MPRHNSWHCDVSPHHGHDQPEDAPDWSPCIYCHQWVKAYRDDNGSVHSIELKPYIIAEEP